MPKASEPDATASTTDGSTPVELWNNGAAEAGAWRFWIEAQETTSGSNATALTAEIVAITHITFEANWVVASTVTGRADIGGASAWTITVALDGSDFLEVNVVGAASDDVDWLIHVEKLN